MVILGRYRGSGDIFVIYWLGILFANCDIFDIGCIYWV